MSHQLRLSMPPEELRYSSARAAAEGRRIVGHAIVFNTLSLDLGGFRERIMPEAVDRTLRERLDVRALAHHDTAAVLGRTTANTLELRKDRTGLHVSIDPPRTAAADDLLVSIGRGDISGMSFRFITLDDRFLHEGGELIREVTDMEIREVSIVTFPAYEQTDASVAKRSLDRSGLARRLTVDHARRRLRQLLNA